jgi:hypothetical protein
MTPFVQFIVTILVMDLEPTFSLRDVVQNSVSLCGEAFEDALEIMPVENTRRWSDSTTVTSRQCHQVIMER